MIHLNEEFNCGNCGKHNEKAQKTCRNHCKFCLFSMHVDQKTPGDRLSDCKSLMEPIGIETDRKKTYIILHRCLKCQKIIRNKAAVDDNQEALINLVTKLNSQLLKQKISFP